MKVNEKYFVFDDVRGASYRFEEDVDVVIHCLFYIDEELLHGDESYDSSFEHTTIEHTDESLYR